jgi:hypothetical protein
MWLLHDYLNVEPTLHGGELDCMLWLGATGGGRVPSLTSQYHIITHWNNK